MSSLFENNSELLTEVGPSQEASLRRKAVQSKLKSLTSQLQLLLQKKIRIDLEIRSTRTKLNKLKTRSSAEFKTSLQFEGVDTSSVPIPIQAVKEAVSPELFEEFQEFDKALREADVIVEQTMDLPLYNN